MVSRHIFWMIVCEIFAQSIHTNNTLYEGYSLQKTYK